MKKTRNYLKRDLRKDRSNDLLTKKKRSALMAKIRSKGTKLERNFIVKIRKVTRKKFSTNVSAIKGKPDIVFLKGRVCIFIDSDFWHGWQYPRWKHLLKNDFWKEKIANNRKRDTRTTIYLRKKRWVVFRFWEHQIGDDYNLRKAINKIKKHI